MITTAIYNNYFNNLIKGANNECFAIVEGLINDNTFAEKLAGKPLKSTHIKHFFTEFNANPDIDKLLQIERTSLLLNVNIHRNLPETFYFSLPYRADPDEKQNL